MPSLRSAFSRVLVAWSIRTGLRSAHLTAVSAVTPGANTVHVNERRRVAKVDDNGGAGANVRYQLPREPPIVLYLVHDCHKIGISVVGAAL